MAASFANSPWRIRRVSSTGSTNADVLAAAAHGEPAGLVLVAGYQTAGRGRLDRRWEAPENTNLLMSVLLRPTGPPDSWFRAVMAFAVAAADALQGIGADVGIKWPNDLLVDDRKIAGVLAESDAAGAVVVGMGCNVHWPAKGELPGATSLRALGIDVTPEVVLEFVLDAFDPASVEAPDLLARYRSRCDTVGREVHLELPGGTTIDGRAIAVDDTGRLVIETEDAATASFSVGDVVHVTRVS